MAVVDQTAASGAMATTGLGRVLRQSDLVMALGVVAVVAMMIVPLPTPLLDLLLITNLTGALVLLLISMYTTEPLAFSVFPSLLLITTLFRLALNISASRLILLQADAGRVIEAFGNFVVGGNYVVGVVVFLILVVIQYVVITNGAGRVAEVAARFTLDAMPGKQMSIDADLNAGAVTEQEARRRRTAIEQEADFYGAMDGASKFVRGDAIAAIIIILINIIGGFVIGVLQLGMPLEQALARYTLLTVGDGLVSQIPALLVSTATGIVVTRAAQEQNMGYETARQILANPRALWLVAAVVAALGFAPGLPIVPFLALAAGLAFIAWIAARAERQAQAEVAAAETAAAAQPAVGPESVTGLLQLDPMELEIGYGLIPLVDPAEAGNLLDRITRIRRQMALELGIVLPTVRVRDNLQLQPNEYVVKIRGVEVARGDLMPNHFLAMSAGLAEGEVEGIPTSEPAFGLPAQWIAPAQKERAELLGYTVVDPPSVLTTHLTEIIKANAATLVGRQETQQLLNNLKTEYPAVVEELVPGLLTLGEVQKVLQNLLRERVPIRDLVTVLETLADHARTSRDPDTLTEYVRQALARTISTMYKNGDGLVHVITLSPRTEQLLADALKQTDQGTMIALEPSLAQRLLQRLATEMERVAQMGYVPLLLCSSRIRLAVRRLTERVLPNLVVLAFTEIASGVDVSAEAMVSLDD